MATRPRDLPHGGRGVRLVWHKRRWCCLSPTCRRATFTESLPDLPARARLTRRKRDELAHAVADSGRTAAEVAAAHQVSWPTTHKAFIAHVDPQLSARWQR